MSVSHTRSLWALGRPAAVGWTLVVGLVSGAPSAAQDSSRGGGSHRIAPPGSEPIDPVAARKELQALRLQLRQVERNHLMMLDLYQDLNSGLQLESRAAQHVFRRPAESDPRKYAQDERELRQLRSNLRTLEQRYQVRRRDWEGLGGGALPGSSGGIGLPSGIDGAVAPGAGPAGGEPGGEHRDLSAWRSGSGVAPESYGVGSSAEPGTLATADENGWVQSPMADSWTAAGGGNMGAGGADPVQNGRLPGDGIPTGQDVTAGSGSRGTRGGSPVGDGRSGIVDPTVIRSQLRELNIAMEKVDVEFLLQGSKDHRRVAALQFEAAQHLFRASQQSTLASAPDVVSSLRKRSRAKYEAAQQAIKLVLDSDPDNLEMRFYGARVLEGLFRLDVLDGTLDFQANFPVYDRRFREVTEAYDDIKTRDSSRERVGNEKVHVLGRWAQAADAANSFLKHMEEHAPDGFLERIRGIRWDRTAEPQTQNGGVTR